MPEKRSSSSKDDISLAHASFVIHSRRKEMHLNTHTATRSKRHGGRAWFVLLAFAAMIALAACGGSTSGGTTPTPTQAGNTPTPTPTTGTTPTATPSGPPNAINICTFHRTFGISPTTI